MSQPNHQPLPGSRRTADPLAVRLLELAARCTLEEQMYLYRRSATALGVVLDDAAAESVETVRACQADLWCQRTGSNAPPSQEALAGEPLPGRDRLRAWLEAQPEWTGWPSEHGVLAPFGGKYTRLREVVEAKPVFDIRALGLTVNGPQATEEMLVAGLREWAASEDFDPELRQDRFFVYARRRTHELEAERRATSYANTEVAFAVSPNTYIDRFGSWAHALDATGLLDGISFETYRRLMSGVKTYTPEVVREAVVAAGAWSQAEHGQRLTQDLLWKWRDHRLRANWRAGVVAPVPGEAPVTRLYGNLAAAFRACGLVDETTATASTVRRGVELSDDLLFAHAWVCAYEKGLTSPARLDKGQYNRWRVQVADALGEPVPCAQTIFRRLGARGWNAAREMLVERGPADPELVATLAARYRAALESAANRDERVAPAGEESS
jgi:hypothetical protein